MTQPTQRPLSIVWFRHDLRTEDNPALHSACEDPEADVIGLYIVPRYIWNRYYSRARFPDWHLQHVQVLADSLAELNIPLHIKTAQTCHDVLTTFKTFQHQHGIMAIHANRLYEHDERNMDDEVGRWADTHNIPCHFFHDQCLHDPDMLLTQAGKPYSVYTPYRKRCLDFILGTDGSTSLPQTAPRIRKHRPTIPAGETLCSAGHSFNSPKPGEPEAHDKLNQFIDSDIGSYGGRRDFPAIDGTSRLSPYMAVGALSLRQVLHAALQCPYTPSSQAWIHELVWRSFYKYINWHFPHIGLGKAFKPDTNTLLWHNDDSAFERWCEGRTGIAIIDAGMRQLNESGWQHNRVRMLTATLLSKYYLLDWRRGEQYFAEQLIDYDFASNNGGWQWCASTGCDAAPYFRVMSPVRQAERFDPDGTYVRHHLPELTTVSDADIHRLNYLTGKEHRIDGMNLKEARRRAIEHFAAQKKG